VALERVIRDSGRPVETVTIQNTGGTRSSIAAGRAFVTEQIAALAAAPTVPMAVSELIVGTVCGGSDGTSGLTGNPAAGIAFDKLVAAGAACIFEETGELIGCEGTMADRAATRNSPPNCAPAWRRPPATTRPWAMGRLRQAMPMAG
jgi:altronate dehydratase large subunit